jgi:tetratricopeptide (TPR) repeat protein
MIAPATPDAFTMAWRRRSATTISACTRIIESDKETPQGRADALTRRAEFHRIGDRFDQAIADCDAALQLDPNYAPAYAGRSQVYRRKGDLLRAMADADKAVALKPSDPRGYDVRGTAHRENGDLDSAIAEYTRAIERDPTYVWPYYNRGFTYAKKGDFAVAIADYGKVIALDATITAAFTQRGVAYEAIGNRRRLCAITGMLCAYPRSTRPANGARKGARAAGRARRQTLGCHRPSRTRFRNDQRRWRRALFRRARLDGQAGVGAPFGP